MEPYTTGQKLEPEYVGPPLVVDIDIARKMISHAEQNTADMTAYYQAELAKAQEEIGKWKHIAIEFAYRFFSGIDPRDAEHRMRFWGMDPEFIALVVAELGDARGKRRQRAE